MSVGENLAHKFYFFPTTYIHTITKDILNRFVQEKFDHPTPFFDNDSKQQRAKVNQWLKSQAADFYRNGTGKLVPHILWYIKYLNLNWESVEKQYKSVPFNV